METQWYLIISSIITSIHISYVALKKQTQTTKKPQNCKTKQTIKKPHKEPQKTQTNRQKPNQSKFQKRKLA